MVEVGVGDEVASGKDLAGDEVQALESQGPRTIKEIRTIFFKAHPEMPSEELNREAAEDVCRKPIHSTILSGSAFFVTAKNMRCPFVFYTWLPQYCSQYSCQTRAPFTAEVDTIRTTSE